MAPAPPPPPTATAAAVTCDPLASRLMPVTRGLIVAAPTETTPVPLTENAGRNNDLPVAWLKFTFAKSTPYLARVGSCWLTVLLPPIYCCVEAAIIDPFRSIGH